MRADVILALVLAAMFLTWLLVALRARRARGGFHLLRWMRAARFSRHRYKDVKLERDIFKEDESPEERERNAWR